MTHTAVVRVRVPKDLVFRFFLDIERWFRLNPEWAVLSITAAQNLWVGQSFPLTVRYDRTEREIIYVGRVEDLTDGEGLTISLKGECPRVFSIALCGENGVTALEYREQREDDLSPQEKREIGLWLKSILNYLLIQEKKTFISRVYKVFIDRVWLRMSPFGRRITLFIVIGEALTFAFFILLLIGLFIFGKL